jgi:hypothetical protein
MASLIVAGDTSGSITISAPLVAGSGVLTLPTGTDTLIGKATTDTLTNKSIAATQLTGTIAAAALPAGSVLQVVSATTNAISTTTSTSFIDISGLSVAITPRSASNNILIMFTIGATANTVGTMNFNIVRGATPIAQPATGTVPATINMFGGGGGAVWSGAMTWLDSPATTSSTTYKIQYRTDNGTLCFNRHPSNVNYNAVSAITLMEIQG